MTSSHVNVCGQSLIGRNQPTRPNDTHGRLVDKMMPDNETECQQKKSVWEFQLICLGSCISGEKMEKIFIFVGVWLHLGMKRLQRTRATDFSFCHSSCFLNFLPRQNKRISIRKGQEPRSHGTCFYLSNAISVYII